MKSSTKSDLYIQPEVSTTGSVDIIYEIVRTPTMDTFLTIDVQKPPDSVTCTRTDCLLED